MRVFFSEPPQQVDQLVQLDTTQSFFSTDFLAGFAVVSTTTTTTITAAVNSPIEIPTNLPRAPSVGILDV